MNKYIIMTKKQLIILGSLNWLITELKNNIVSECWANRDDYVIKEIREKINLTQHLRTRIEDMSRGFKKKKKISLGTYIKAWEELMQNYAMNYAGLLKKVQKILIS